MGKSTKELFYPPLEEKLNVWTHAFGIVLSVIGFVLLLLKPRDAHNHFALLSYIIYGTSLILLYTASTIYHNSKDKKTRIKLNILDHSSIYVLIAGTYSPYALITLEGDIGWLIFIIIWSFAIIGIILKLFFTGRFRILSTAMYVFMGWIIVFAVKPLMENLSPEGLWWLLIGGLSYTFGAVLYSINKIKFNHAIFHVFVLIGSIANFISIYFYVYTNYTMK
jgi:hemolysin III